MSRVLMGASAVFLAVLGGAASFMPEEILRYTETIPAPLINAVVQTAGALFLGFALLNWLSRGLPIAGTRARPLALGNFLHFAVVAVTLARVLYDVRLPLVIGLAACYTVFAVCFGVLLFARRVRPDEAG